MFDYPYVIELLNPKRSEQDVSREALDLFGEKYRKIYRAGCGASFPDNPMGRPRFSLVEMIDRCRLQVHAEKTIMNLNTFHAKEELDRLLKAASGLGLKYLLVIRGDGGPALPKLDPGSIGGHGSVATSIDLLAYINREYRDVFITGAAFNQYNRLPFEMSRLRKKMDAGARFVVTQPVIGKDPRVDELMGLDTAVVVEAWMSGNLDLLYKSVRGQKSEAAEPYDATENLKVLHDAYPKSCVYLSMLGFKKDWQEILPRL